MDISTNTRFYFSLLGILLLVLGTARAQIASSKDNTLYEDDANFRSNGQGEHFFVGFSGGESSGDVLTRSNQFDDG